jgi:hypothetical protein
MAIQFLRVEDIEIDVSSDIAENSWSSREGAVVVIDHESSTAPHIFVAETAKNRSKAVWSKVGVWW